MDEFDKNLKKFDYHLKTLWGLLIFIVISPTVGFLLVKQEGWSFEDLGPFGDFIAGTTVPILTFISFLALVLTLRVQMEQLRLQRVEAKATIAEIKASREDVELSYKPQFENVTDEDINEVLHIANLNPNYQSFEIINVSNKTTGKTLNFEKELIDLLGGKYFIKVNFPILERSTNNDNIIEIHYKSIIGKEYMESIILPIDSSGEISLKSIKGLVFK